MVFAVTAAALSIPQLLWVRPGTMAGEQTYPAFFWGYVIEDPTVANVASYLAFVFGPKLLLAAVALAAATWRQWRVFIAFSGLVALAFLMQLSVEVLANHKFINAWLIVANVFAAQGLIRLWRARPTCSPRTGSDRGRCPRGDHRCRRHHRPDSRQEPVDARVRHGRRSSLRMGADGDGPEVPCSLPTSSWSTRSSWRGARSTTAGRTTPGLPVTTFCPARRGIATSWPSGALAVSPSSCTSGGSTTWRSTTGCDGSRSHRS